MNVQQLAGTTFSGCVPLRRLADSEMCSLANQFYRQTMSCLTGTNRNGETPTIGALPLVNMNFSTTELLLEEGLLQESQC